MEDDAHSERDELLAQEDLSTRTLFHGTYGVSVFPRHLDILRLNDASRRIRRLHIPYTSRGNVLPLTSINEDRLAVSHGSEISVYDLKELNLLCTVSGIGRVVTALCLHPQWKTRLAAGYIDSSVVIWDVKTPRRPIRRLQAAAGPCYGIAFKPGNDNIFATAHYGSVVVWSLRNGQWVSTIGAEKRREPFTLLAWQAGEDANRLAVVSGDELLIYKPNYVHSESSTEGYSDESSQVSGDSPETNPVDLIAHFPAAVSHLEWLSSNVILLQEGVEAVFLDYVEGQTDLDTLWTCELESSTATVSLQTGQLSAHLVAFDRGSPKTYDVPTHLFDRLQSTAALDTAETHQRTAIILHERQVGAEELATLSNTSAIMRPISIMNQRLELSSSSKPSNLLRKRRAGPSRELTAQREGPSANEAVTTPPQIRSMTSSLELPQPNGSDHNSSPMPFLSPSIPARNSPQTVIAPLEDSVFELSPLPESFNTAATPTTSLDDDDDDSDDEAFADRLQGSGIFLPGGIHVPLPKACGALFAPNGQLLTFFPPKPSPTVIQQDIATTSSTQKNWPQTRVKRATRLFPTFGNLVGDAIFHFDDSESNSSADSDQREGEEDQWIEFPLLPSSFQSRQARISPIKQTFGSLEAANKINISIYELDNAHVDVKNQQSLANTYRYLRDEDMSGSEVCRHNCHVAEAAGMHDIAHIWRLLEMVVEDKVPLKAISVDDECVLVVAQRAISLRQEDAAASDTVRHGEPFGHLRWADDAFGRAWFVHAIFEWAEKSADIQHLASFAAVLAESDRSVLGTESKIEDVYLSKLSSYSPNYQLDENYTQTRALRRSQPVPMLQPSLTQVQLPVVHESPIKENQASNASSRNASQPTTPYFEASSTTPPFSLPPLARQGTRLSASGSASPEAHRSSFSAAAKSYAQSITDKFASYTAYGTSPPMRRLGGSASPGNELSTSLPSGSWTKSVSFAASPTTAMTSRAGQLSRSFDEQYVEGSYDSDKTVEDESLPQTPRSGTGDIMVTQKNKGFFDDEFSGGAKVPLLPDEIAIKAQLWVKHYAEQLRTWGLLMKAAELEKIVGIATSTTGAHDASVVAQSHIKPVPLTVQARYDTCVICTTRLQSTEVMCPVCLHTSHITCLTEYCIALAGEDFQCPAGCDCTCPQLPYVTTEASVPSPDRPLFRKKPSFTDPIRWRARNEGDSW